MYGTWHFGAAVSALTVSALGLLGAGTSRRWDISAPAFRRRTFRRRCKGLVANWWPVTRSSLLSGVDNNQVCTLPKSVQANLLWDEKWRQNGNWTYYSLIPPQKLLYLPKTNFWLCPWYQRCRCDGNLHGLSRDYVSGAETLGAETAGTEMSQRRNGECRNGGNGGAETVAPKRRRRNTKCPAPNYVVPVVTHCCYHWIHGNTETDKPVKELVIPIIMKHTTCCISVKWDTWFQN